MAYPVRSAQLFNRRREEVSLVTAPYAIDIGLSRAPRRPLCAAALIVLSRHLAVTRYFVDGAGGISRRAVGDPLLIESPVAELVRAAGMRSGA